MIKLLTFDKLVPATTTFSLKLVVGVTTAITFSRQNDAGSRVSNTQCWENLVLAVVLVPESKALDCCRLTRLLKLAPRPEIPRLTIFLATQARPQSLSPLFLVFNMNIFTREVPCIALPCLSPTTSCLPFQIPNRKRLASSEGQK